MPNDEQERIARELISELRARMPASQADSEKATEAQLLELARQMVSLAQTTSARDHNDPGGVTKLCDNEIASCQRAEGVWNILALAHGPAGDSQSPSGSRLVVEVAAQHAASELAIHGPEAIKALVESGERDPTKTPAMMAEPLRALFSETLDKPAGEAVSAGEQETGECDKDDGDDPTTLLLVAHTHTPFGELVGSYWIGNKAVAGALRKRVSGIEAGETDDSMSRIGCTIIPAVNALTLMSDVDDYSLFTPDGEDKSDEPRWRFIFMEAPLPAQGSKDASTDQPAHEEVPTPQFERDATASSDQDATDQPAQINSDAREDLAEHDGSAHEQSSDNLGARIDNGDASQYAHSEETAPGTEQAPPRSAAIDALRRPGTIPVDALPRAEPQPQRMHATIASNANAGEPYRSAITVSDDSGRLLPIRDCSIPPESGVEYRDGFLFGSTPNAGEYLVLISCASADADVSRTVRTQLIVNHDPRSLWQDQPSDRDAPGWKPDKASRRLVGSHGRQLVAASVRGRSHAHTGGFRDDDFALRVSADGTWNILAVADGAGSASRSRIGSRLAVDVAVGQAEIGLVTHGQAVLDSLLTPGESDSTRDLRILFYNALGKAALETVKAIEQKAKDHAMEPRDYATTLLLAVHTHTAIGDVVGTYWVGDGAIAILPNGGGLRLLGKPDSGEFSGQTRFLDRSAVSNAEEIMSRIDCAVIPSLAALLLMSDGVSDPRFATDAEFRDAVPWWRLWDEIQPLASGNGAPEKLFAWLQFWSKGHHDDRTIAWLF